MIALGEMERIAISGSNSLSVVMKHSWWFFYRWNYCGFQCILYDCVQFCTFRTAQYVCTIGWYYITTNALMFFFQMLEPIRRAVEILNVLLSRNVPTNFDGRADNHASDSLCRGARCNALSLFELNVKDLNLIDINSSLKSSWWLLLCGTDSDNNDHWLRTSV